MGRLLIVDGHAYAYRAFHAIRRLNSPEGRPTNAIYGFIKMLAKLRATIQPTHAIVVWDGGLSSSRVELLPAYKAQRPEMPADLEAQLDDVIHYLGAAGIASYCQGGVEADDYIACLVKHATAASFVVVIASSDKDFMQLVSPNVGLLNPSEPDGPVWTEARVLEKTGVRPEQIVDWLGLIGDFVDNIPGVPGVGPKTAADLLKQFGSVTAILDRLSEVKSERIRSALAASAAAVKRNIQLVKLKDDLSCDFDAKALAGSPPDKQRLREFYQRCGFKTLLAELEAAQQQTLI